MRKVYVGREAVSATSYSKPNSRISNLLLHSTDNSKTLCPNPSYPPIRIRIHNEMVGGSKLAQSVSWFQFCGVEANTYNFYCYGSYIYMELQTNKLYDDPNSHHKHRFFTDRYFQLDLSVIDFFHPHEVRDDSTNWCLVEMKQNTHSVDYCVENCSQQFQNGEIIIKSVKMRSFTEKYVDVFVINLQKKTVDRVKVEHFYRVPYEYTLCRFTIFNNKFLIWRDHLEKLHKKFQFQYQVQPCSALPIQSLYHMCWEKLYLLPIEPKKCTKNG